MEPMEMAKIVLMRNLKELRKSKGWNQDHLAEKTGYSLGFIKDIERGKSWVSPEAVGEIATALGVEISDLFMGSRDSNIERMSPRDVLKMYLNVPDNILEYAVKLGSDHSVWDDIKPYFEDALIELEAKKPKSKKA